MRNSMFDDDESGRCSFDGGIHDAMASRAELVDLFEHHYVSLDRHAKEREKTDS